MLNRMCRRSKLSPMISLFKDNSETPLRLSILWPSTIRGSSITELPFEVKTDQRAVSSGMDCYEASDWQVGLMLPLRAQYLVSSCMISNPISKIRILNEFYMFIEFSHLFI